MPVRVMTWNMAKRPRAFKYLWSYMHERLIDVALIQEAPLVDKYKHRDDWEAVWAPNPAPDTRIVARRDLGLRLVAPGPMAVFGDYATVAQIDVPGVGPVQLCSVHAQARGVYAHEFEDAATGHFDGRDGPAFLNDLAMRLLDKLLSDGLPLIAGCDLNTSRQWGAGRFFEEASGAGLEDITWRLLDQTQQPSYFTSRSSQHQVDYLVADTTTAESSRNAVIDADVSRVEKISDHAPVFADFFVDG